jgi:hypothetical protein
VIISDHLHPRNEIFVEQLHYYVFAFIDIFGQNCHPNSQQWPHEPILVKNARAGVIARRQPI